MKHKLFSCLAILLTQFFITQVAFSQPQIICPTIKAIQTDGFDFVTHNLISETWVIGKTKSKYETDRDWMFEAILFGTKNEKLALKKANREVALYEYKESGELNGNFVCIYAKPSQDDAWHDSFGVALTPIKPAAEGSMLDQLVGFILGPHKFVY